MVALAPPQPDVKQLTRIIHAAVSRKWSLFKQFPDLTEDDLTQHCLPRALQMHETFDGERAQYSTWITRGVNFALLDYHKSRRGEQRRVDSFESQLREPQSQDENALDVIRDWFNAGCPTPPDAMPATLVEWVGNVYRQARRVFPDRSGKRGRSWFPPAQVVTIAMLMRRRRLSTRGCRDMLEMDQELRQAIGIARRRNIPCQQWFVQATRRAETYLQPPNIDEK